MNYFSLQGFQIYGFLSKARFGEGEEADFMKEL